MQYSMFALGFKAAPREDDVVTAQEAATIGIRFYKNGVELEVQSSRRDNVHAVQRDHPRRSESGQLRIKRRFASNV